MYRHFAIKSDVLPGYEFPKFSEGDVSQQTLPNKACTGRVLDVLSESTQRIRQTMKAEEMENLKKLFGARAQLAALTEKSSSSLENLGANRDEIARISALVRNYERILGEQSAKYHLFWEPFSLKKLQAALPADTASSASLLF